VRIKARRIKVKVKERERASTQHSWSDNTWIVNQVRLKAQL
jgi:hypothetical protein